jgi:alkylated DNA repair dioxygenase AlkB
MAAEELLFGPDWPPGFQYAAGFITPQEEHGLTTAVASVEFSLFEMRGVIARRRVAFFGHAYDAAREASGPIPEFLLPVRARLARWAGVGPDSFEMALINEYRPGSPIGWHRDAPQYGIVAGLSLVASCRMRFRRYVAPSAARTAPPARRQATHEITLEPRSAYLMTDEARNQFEHSIPPVKALRYSITFRTLRRA